MKNSIQPPTSVLTQLRQKMVGCPELLRDDLRHLVEPLEARIAPALTLSGLAADAVSEFPLPPFDVLDETLGTIPGITTGSQPPDTVMDVGLNHVIQIVNSTNYQVWDKHGNPLTAPISLGSIFPPADPIAADVGDPIVVYDHLADRWVLSQFGRPNQLGFAISRTPDPVGGVDGIANNGDEFFTYTFNTGVFPDYPKIGVWPDGYYVTSYEDPLLGIYAFERNKMLVGDPTATFVKRTISDLNPAAGYRDTRILPADLDGIAPPTGTPNFFLRTVDGNQDTADPRDRIEIFAAVPDFVNGTFAFTLIEDLDAGDGLDPFNTMRGNRNGQGVRDMIPQPGTIDTIDSLSNRPMMQLKFRDFGDHFGLVVNQTVDVQNVIQADTGFNPAQEVAGIRWYELRSLDEGANWGIEQQGDFTPQNTTITAENQLLHRWMGSAAFDGSGNIGLAYSITNSDNANPIFPGIRYAGRLAGEAAGEFPQGEKVIFNGTTFQGNGNAAVEPQRWGDYSALSVDPLDDHKFWYSTHVANGATQIGAFFIDDSPPGFQFDSGHLTISGNLLTDGQNDEIRVIRDAADPTDVLIFINGVGPIPDYRVPLAQLQQIGVFGLSGNDTLVVDSTNGLINIARGIDYNGGTGHDALQLLQTGGAAQLTDVYSIGPNNGDGSSVITGAGGSQTVRFQNIEPVLDNVPAATLIVNGTPANNAINYAQGPGGGPFVGNTGRVTIDNFEPLEFNNKTNLVINALAGGDETNLNNPVTPAGLTGNITVNGGDPTASDTLIVNGTTGSDTFGYTPSNTIGAGSVTRTGAATVNFTTIEQLDIDGQDGTDALTISGGSGRRITYTPGSAPDAGTIEAANFGAGTGLVPLRFSHLGALGNVTFAGSGPGTDILQVNGTTNSDTFAVTGTTVQITNTTGGFTSVLLNTPGVFAAELRGLDSDDTFNLSGNLAPYSGGVVVDGGNPSASDVVNLTGTGAAITANYAALTVQETGSGLVRLTGVETLNIAAAAAALNVRGTTGQDALTYTPTAPTNGNVTRNGSNLAISFTNVVAAFTIDSLGGSDTLTVNGTQDADDLITATGGLVTVDPAGAPPALKTVNYLNTEDLRINGLSGDDVIDVTPTANTTISIDGGDPIGGTTGDTLILRPTGFSIVQPGPENDEGGLVNPPNQRVSWDHIEAVSVIGGGPALILGTNGDDDITIIARDVSTHAGTDGVQDFTVSVNTGANILFIDTAVVLVDALAGDDEIVVREPAPNSAVWNVQAFIAGGTPATSANPLGDVVQLETPGTQTVTFTPSPAAFTIPALPAGVTLTTPAPGGIDTAILADTTNTSVIAITPFTLTVAGPAFTYQSSPGGADAVVYQGLAGDDTLTINGTSIADTFILNPTAAGSGSLRSGRSPLFDFAGATTLAVNGGTGGFDLVNVLGTSNNNAIAAIVAGANTNVTVDTAPPVAIDTATIDSLRIDGLDGNDTLTVDSSAGPVTIPILYDGGDRNDTLTLTGGTALTNTYTPGPVLGSGKSVLTFAGGTETINFANIEPVLDVVGGPLTIIANGANNAIDYAGVTGTGQAIVTIDDHESIQFGGKSALTINSGNGSDTINLFSNQNATDTGFAGAATITIIGAGPTAATDTLVFTGTTGADSYFFTGNTISDGTVTVSTIAGVTVNYNTIEQLILDGQAGDDTFVINRPGAALGGKVKLIAGDGADTVSFAGTGVGAFTTLGNNGVLFDLDAVNVDQRYNALEALNAIVTLGDRMENFIGTTNNDVLYIDAAAFPRTVDGGAPPVTSPGNPIPPGDTLFMDGQGSVVNVIHTTFNNGSILTQEHQVIAYVSWETLRINNSPTNTFEADAFGGGSLYSSAPAGSITASNRTTAPSGVAVGDLNGDGVPDMAVANSKTVNNVTVFLGKGDGTFGTTPGVDFFNFSSGGANPATNKPSDIAIGDITGDGKPDLIVVNIGTKTIGVIPNTIPVFPGNPVGTPVSFGTATVTGKLKFVPRALTVGNVTGDAGLDVVVANPSPGNVAIFTNVAGALPAGPSLTLNPGGAGTSDVTIGDYNKDGLNDIAAVNKAANSVTNSISLFLATGPGVIPTTPTLGLKRSDLGLQGLRPASLTTSDFNGDGIDDIAVTDQLSRSITTLLGNTNTVRPVVPFTFKAMLFTSLPKSAFATSIGSGLPGSAGSLILGDFNSDGKQDIAITPSIGGELRVLLGTGVGDFSQPYVFDLGNWASRVVSNVVITDLNNDGAPDIVLANYTTSNVGVLLRKV